MCISIGGKLRCKERALERLIPSLTFSITISISSFITLFDRVFLLLLRASKIGTPAAEEIARVLVNLTEFKVLSNFP